MKGAPKIRAVGSDERPTDGQSKASAKRPRLTGAEARAEVLRLFSSGEQPEAIAKQLALRLDHVNRHIKHGMERVVTEYAQASPQELFARFALSQVELARRLRDAEDNLLASGGTKYSHAIIASVRARSEINASVLDKAIEFGVVQKTKVSDVVHKSGDELLAELKKEASLLGQLIAEVEGGGEQPGSKQLRGIKRAPKPQVRATYDQEG